MRYGIAVGSLLDCVNRENPIKKKCKLVINNNKIESISLNTKKEIIQDNENKRDKLEVINAEKYTLMPGLIDSHVHLMMNHQYEQWTKWIVKKKEIILLNAVKNISKLLKSGVTTARDCGAYGNMGFVLRQAVQEGIIEGPRLLISGNPITITGGHCYFLGIEADNKFEIIKAVRRMCKLNVDFIKFMATGGSLTPESDRRRAQYDLEETKALVDESHKWGKRVCAHCIGTEGIVNSAKAGVDTIEHCCWVAPKTGFLFDQRAVSEMVKKKIFVDPCLPYTLRSNIYPEKEAVQHGNRPISTKRVIEDRAILLRKTFQAGVKMLASTDAGVPGIDFCETYLSIKLLNDWIGIPKIDSIFGATNYAAVALGLQDKIGTIEEGKIADLVIIDGNPLEKLDVLKNVVMVIKDGRIKYFDSSKFKSEVIDKFR